MAETLAEGIARNRAASLARGVPWTVDDPATLAVIAGIIATSQRAVIRPPEAAQAAG